MIITGTALSYPSTLSFEAVPPEVGTQGTMYRTTIKMYISTPSKVKKKDEELHIDNALKDALTTYKVLKTIFHTQTQTVPLILFTSKH